jgi:3,4-dihydroxy 2-butanone 4-phosphate synthase/GTP cyclohydrolase II
MIDLFYYLILIMQMVVVVDDEDRENEGDLIMAAQLATPEAMAFIVKHGTGIVCVSMKEEDLDRLELPLMVDSKANAEKLCTAFTVTVVCITFHLYTRASSTVSL